MFYGFWAHPNTGRPPPPQKKRKKAMRIASYASVRKTYKQGELRFKHFCSCFYNSLIHLQINKMGFNAKGTGDPFTFTLINRKRGPEIKFQVQAPNAEVYQNWTTQIKSILDMQSQFLLGRWRYNTRGSRPIWPCSSRAYKNGVPYHKPWKWFQSV